MTLHDLLSRFRFAKPPNLNRTDWFAFCPIHSETKPSLHLTAKADRLLAYCQGCNAEGEAIAAAVGLRLSDLYFDDGAPSHIGFPKRARGNERRVRGSPTRTRYYEYQQAGGTVAYRIVREDYSDGSKECWAQHPDGRGRWSKGLGGAKPLLYRLPEVLAAVERGDFVWVVEGEECADRAHELGVTATTAPFGAGKWRSEYRDALRGAHVRVLPDHDGPGEGHALDVLSSVAGEAATLKRIDLPGLPDKGDIVDWLRTGHTLAELLALETAAPKWTPDAAITTNGDGGPRPVRSASGLVFTRLSDILAQPDEEYRWLVDGLLLAGGTSLMVAKPKVGKSTAARCLCRAVARGEPWLGRATIQGAVLYLGLEDKREEVKRHFRAMGCTEADPIYVFCDRVPQQAIEKLHNAALEHTPALIVVDPLFRLMTGVRDVNDYAGAMAALTPFITLARETGAHLKATHHAGKVDREGGDAILGTTALFGSVDTALLLKRTDRYRTIRSIQRYGQDLPELVLAYDEATMTVTAGLPRREAEAAELAQAIVAYLGTVTSPVEEDAIRENVEGQNAARVRALRELVKAGKVTRTGEGKRGSAYLYGLPSPQAPGLGHDSGSLVPTYTREQENEKPETGRKPLSTLQNFSFPGSDPSEPKPLDSGTSISPPQDLPDIEGDGRRRGCFQLAGTLGFPALLGGFRVSAGAAAWVQALIDAPTDDVNSAITALLALDEAGGR